MIDTNKANNKGEGPVDAVQMKSINNYQNKSNK